MLQYEMYTVIWDKIGKRSELYTTDTRMILTVKYRIISQWYITLHFLHTVQEVSDVFISSIINNVCNFGSFICEDHQFLYKISFENTCGVYRTILHLLNFWNFCSVHRYVERKANFQVFFFFLPIFYFIVKKCVKLFFNFLLSYPIMIVRI